MDHPFAPGVGLRMRTPGQAAAGPLRYALGACSLGALLVARSGQGVCAILLDDRPEALAAQLAQAFPDTACREDGRAMRGDLARVSALIDAPSALSASSARCASPAPSAPSAATHPAGPGPRIELDVGGTAFQQRVWQALCEIPPGRTLSYAELARRIGAPAAVRAVGSACAANVLAVAIPCHRVLRSDGSITGYRWGPQRKRELLRREAG